MTLDEYYDLQKKIDSGEVDYDALPREVRRETRRIRMEIMRKEVDETEKILKKAGLPTGTENLRRDKDTPAYATASKTKIIAIGPKSEKIAKEMKKKRKVAIKKTSKKFIKHQKENAKKAEKKAKKLRKKLKKKELKKLCKKARKIYDKLDRVKQLEYDRYREKTGLLEMITKIIEDRKEAKRKKKAAAVQWASWVSFHEYDPDNEKDVEALTAQVMEEDEPSPYERYRQREIISGRPDPESFCGKYMKPRIRLEESDKVFYANSSNIKLYDWDEFGKYLKHKKLKSPGDILKYRKKFNWKKLKTAEKQEGPRKSRGKNSWQRGMYIPLASRDADAALKEYKRIAKSGERLKYAVQDFAEFIRQHHPDMNQETYDNLEKFIAKQDKSVKNFVKEAKTALELADYQSMHDDEVSNKWKTMDIECPLPKYKPGQDNLII